MGQFQYFQCFTIPNKFMYFSKFSECNMKIADTICVYQYWKGCLFRQSEKFSYHILQNVLYYSITHAHINILYTDITHTEQNSAIWEWSHSITMFSQIGIYR